MNKSHTVVIKTYFNIYSLQVISVGSKVLLKNMRRSDRKGGKASDPWIGPYVVMEVKETGTCRLKNKRGVVLKRSFNASQLKML